MEGDGYTHAPAGRPVLFVDIDGVLSLFGFDASRTEDLGPVHWIDGIAHCIPVESGERLVRLAERFDLVWASGWEDRANDHLPYILDLPFHRLPWLNFGGQAIFGSSNWKLETIDLYAGARPAAWIDDNIDDECRLWAQGRDAPTLLVETHCNVGMTEEHVETLLAWAEALDDRRARKIEAA